MMNKFDGKWGSGRWENITRVGELINLAKYREKFKKLAPNLQDFFLIIGDMKFYQYGLKNIFLIEPAYV